MPFSFTSPTVASSALSARWNERYVTSGINRKLTGIVPSGIYRGLILTANVTDNTVSVAVDPVKLDNVAVYQTADGYTITYRTSTAFTLDLSDASLLSQELVIVMYVDYQEQAETTAEFRAYTAAEYAALSAGLRGELLVLGTVVNVAAATAIPAGNITPRRRSAASLADSVLSWRQLLTNTGFERAEDARVITGFEVDGWASTGNWKVISSGMDTGSRALEFNVSGAGTYSETLTQPLGVNVVSGQQVLVRLSKKIIGAASSGTGQIAVRLTGNGGTAGQTLTSDFAINATDPSYSVIEAWFTIPADINTIAYIAIKLVSAVYASGGAKVRIDTLSALLQPMSVDDQLSSDAKQRALSASFLTLEDGVQESAAARAALLRYSQSTPSNEGRVVLDRKDQDYSGTNLPPALEVPGRLYSLGNRLLGTEANNLLPRIEAAYSTTAGVDAVLLWESAQAGEVIGGYTQPVARLYIGSSVAFGHGDFIFTSNARWDGAAWNKDVTGVGASITKFSSGALGFFVRDVAADTPWTSWSSVLTIGLNTLLAVGNLSVLSGDVTLTAGKHVKFTGSSRVCHGNYIRPFGFSSGSIISSTAGVTHTDGTPGLTQAANSTAFYRLGHLDGREQLNAFTVWGSGTGAALSLVYEDEAGVYIDIAGASGAFASGYCQLVPDSPETATGKIYSMKIITDATHTATIKKGEFLFDVPA